jgi:CHAT domain-containing protein
VRGGPAPGVALAAQLARLEPLPDTAEELRSIAQSLGASPERDVFLGRDAAEERVKTMDLSRRRVIAFATHALVTGELEGLDEPALALSAPAGAGDGLLTLGEMLALRLDADWMLLSACNTAAGAAGDAEVLSGLGRAAFYAGARALLVSHWAVESSSARRLTTGALERQRQAPLTRAEALRQSMLALIEGAGPAHLAHPVFWAPFVLVGDGG